VSTGWPITMFLLQDCNKKLALWFASRLDAQAVIRRQWPDVVKNFYLKGKNVQL
jgi:hypothetical protein